MQTSEGAITGMIKHNGKWVPECSVCGPVLGENWLLPNLNFTEFFTMYPHIEKYFEIYDIPKHSVAGNICNECIITMELKCLQEVKVEDMPLLINANFYSDTAREYFKKIIKSGEKEADVVVFASVLKKLSRIAGEAKKEENIVG